MHINKIFLQEDIFRRIQTSPYLKNSPALTNNYHFIASSTICLSKGCSPVSVTILFMQSMVSSLLLVYVRFCCSCVQLHTYGVIVVCISIIAVFSSLLFFQITKMINYLVLIRNNVHIHILISKIIFNDIVSYKILSN